MNNKEREMWVRNDEWLYLWWIRSRDNKGKKLSISKFIKVNREGIDRYIKGED